MDKYLEQLVIQPPVGEAGFSSARLRTYVRVCVCVCVCVCVTTLQCCGGIRAVEALLLSW